MAGAVGVQNSGAAQWGGAVAVLGLGAIGVELGQALRRMGIEVTGFDLLNTISGLRDPVASAVAVELLRRELPMVLGHPAELSWDGDCVRVSAGGQHAVVDGLLVAVGRVSNADQLGFEQIGVKVNARGVPEYNPHTMQVGDLPIFVAGDVSGERLVQHEAADEGRIAGHNAASGRIEAFCRKTPLAICFTDPNIVTAGLWYNQLHNPDEVVIGEARLDGSGRALVMGKNHGVIRVYAEPVTGKLLGAALVAPHAEHLGHLLAWSIQLGLTAFDLLRTPYYHPVIEEALQNAVYDVVATLGRQVDHPPELQRC